MRSIKVDKYEVLAGLYYTKEHEWVKIESDYVKVGITDYAQKTLHEIVYVELPKAGKIVAQMEPLGTVESIKAVSEVYSPLSGEIIKVNEALGTSPELVNKSPYDAGWIVSMKPEKLDEELKKLKTADQYVEYIKQIIDKE